MDGIIDTPSVSGGDGNLSPIVGTPDTETPSVSGNATEEVVNNLVKEVLESEGYEAVTGDGVTQALLEQILASNLKQEKQNEASISCLLFFLVIIALVGIYKFFRIFF